MQQRGAHLVPLAPLDDLRALVARPGDVLSVYLPLRPANEELAEEVRLEWRGLREEAERAGATPEALSVVDRAVDGAHRGSAGLVVVVPHDGEPLVEGLERPPPRPTVTWGPVPALLPLLADRQRRQPHVVALVDRQGADILAATGRSEPVGAATDHSVTTVQGTSFPLRKVAPGGWSQRRFQQRAEETWQRNMGRVADEVVHQVARVDARFVAVGGDERAVGLLLEHLPVAVRDLVRPLHVTRATDGSGARLDEEVERVLDEWLRQETTRAAETYREELGQRDRAVAGPGDTLAALRAARVAQLLVVDGVAGANGATGGAGTPSGAAGAPGTRTSGPPGGAGAGGSVAAGGSGGAVGAPQAAAAGFAWVGSTPEDVSVAFDDLLDPDQGRPAPQHDVAVAAALATGADVRVLPGPDAPDDPGDELASGGRSAPPDPEETGVEASGMPADMPEGIGALLRW